MEYINTLPPLDRPVARVWAEMPDDEFKARIGPAVNEIQESLVLIKYALDEMKESWWRVAAKKSGLLGLGGIIVEVARTVVDNPNFWHPRP